MARVTVEDCVDKVPNRFDLVMLASHRAREVSAGSPITVDRDNDKNPVVALREIADETQSADALREQYFGWNPDKFADRSAHNQVRAAGQLQLHRSLHSKLAEAEDIVEQAFRDM